MLFDEKFLLWGEVDFQLYQKVITNQMLVQTVVFSTRLWKI